MIDLSGTPPSANDIDQAIAEVGGAMVRYLSKVPPELAVQLTNILRCLKRLKELESSKAT